MTMYGRYENNFKRSVEQKLVRRPLPASPFMRAYTEVIDGSDETVAGHSAVPVTEASIEINWEILHPGVPRRRCAPVLCWLGAQDTSA